MTLSSPHPSETPPPPPPERKSPEEPALAPEGDAGKRAQASPVLAAAIPVREPTVTAAPSPASGEQARSGAALVGIGPGAGSGGNGPGGGGSGSGGGDARLGGTPAEWTGGAIKRSDYPKAAREAGLQGTTETEITVGEKGRATGCRVARTSGSALLDQTTCRLILQRFRFRPARDRYGRTITDMIGYDQEWVFTRLDPE